MADKPQVAAFINFYLSSVDDVIGKVGYFPAPKAALDGAMKTWLEVTGSAAATGGDKATAAAGGMLPAVNPLEVKGDIITAGSSTVFPLSEAVAEKFREEGYGGNITIDSIGTGAGFERFCKTGETDIANASRAIKDAEEENCVGDRADAGGVPGGDGCAGDRGEPGERLAEERRDAGGAGEAVLEGNDELVGREPGVAGAADQALLARHGFRARSTTSSKR